MSVPKKTQREKRLNLVETRSVPYRLQGAAAPRGLSRNVCKRRIPTS